MILAGLALGATRGYVYIRHEYPEQAAAVRLAIAAAEKLGVCGRNLRGTGIDFYMGVFISPGGYICGEQSALIEAMEGKRAQPRNRPPELATNGLFDKPTLVNNVETFAWVPGIALKTSLGPEKVVNWYGSKGPNSRGMRFFSISGDVNRPGAYEMPIGAQFGELLEAAGGVIGGENNLLSVASSGPSGGFLPARALRDVKAAKDPRGTFRSRNLLEIELDIDEFRKLGGALGAGIVVYAQGTDMTSQAVNATEFYRNESCGKCVPCRVGSQKLVELGLRLKSDTRPQLVQSVRAAVRDLDKALEQTSICGLGQVAPKPLLTLLRYFRPADASADWSMMSMPAIVLPDRPTRK
jgi:NADH:ubiquinone oxidoreductase subunit F (NADH-binding)